MSTYFNQLQPALQNLLHISAAIQRITLNASLCITISVS